MGKGQAVGSETYQSGPVKFRRTNMLNINSLHSHFESNIFSRRTGKTTATLVSAIQQADFGVPNVLIIGKTQAHLDILYKMFIDLAHELSFSIVKIGRRKLRINSTVYRFSTSDEDRRGLEGKVFYDHHQ